MPNCNQCGRPIVFVRTRKGHKIAVDAETARPGDTLYCYGRHVRHKETCKKKRGRDRE